MSEFSESSPKEMSFSSLLLSEFHLFCSFVRSHPFYFSYTILIFPYMFKILSFLSPLFVTTTILLLALLTTLHGHNNTESLETQPSFLFAFCSSVLETKFDVNNDEDFTTSLEEYKMVVEACAFIECVSDNESKEITFVDKFCSHESTVAESLIDEEPVEIIQPLKFEDPMDLEKEEETEKCEKEEENKVKPKSLESGLVQPTTQESKVQKVDLVGDGNDDLPKFSDFLRQEKKNEEEEEDVALRSFGSMRKEKEWRRTLACKLFEERHNADVGQGMDQLWETYETQTDMKKHTDEETKKEKMTKTKLMVMKTKSIDKKDLVVLEEEEEDEEDEDGIDQQQLCCLQALKFSTKKMHIGIARPNLLKLSKAFKGFGRFYKHPKKV